MKRLPILMLKITNWAKSFEDKGFSKHDIINKGSLGSKETTQEIHVQVMVAQEV